MVRGEMDLERVVGTIFDVVEAWNSGEYATPERLLRLNKAITSNLLYLSGLKAEYHTKWLAAYHNFNGSNAAAEKHADTEVKELYYCRQIMTAGSKVAIAISQELKIITNEQLS